MSMVWALDIPSNLARAALIAYRKMDACKDVAERDDRKC